MSKRKAQLYFYTTGVSPHSIYGVNHIIWPEIDGDNSFPLQNNYVIYTITYIHGHDVIDVTLALISSYKNW